MNFSDAKIKLIF